MSDPSTSTYQDLESELCIQGPSPSIITAWLLQFLWWKFGNLNNIHDPGLHDSNYLWVPDDHSSIQGSLDKGILITQAHAWSPEDAQQRPAILVQQGPQQPVRELSTIGGGRYGPSTLLAPHKYDANKYPNAGQEAQNEFISGQHRIIFIHKTGYTAELLGLEVWNELIDRKSQIRKDANLSKFNAGALSSASKVKESQNHWALTTNINYVYQRHTMITWDSPFLKKIVIENQVS